MSLPSSADDISYASIASDGSVDGKSSDLSSMDTAEVWKDVLEDGDNLISVRPGGVGNKRIRSQALTLVETSRAEKKAIKGFQES